MQEHKLQQFLTHERLPESYLQTVRDVLQPLAAGLTGLVATKPGMLVGINGAQGSGKTTLAKMLALLLQENHGINVAMLSLDDFYLTRTERNALADRVHPLLATRGVPGTHDVTLMSTTLDALTDRSPGAATEVRLPLFDKSTDDRAPPETWPVQAGQPDIILLEGWCVGLSAQAENALDPSVNDLEDHEDREGRWRRYVNEQLAQQYRTVFDRLDILIMLRVPSFYCVLEWRWLQECKMNRPLMDRKAVQRFIQHFERLTRHGLQSLPGAADLVLSLDANHRISEVTPDIDTLLPSQPGAPA